MPNKILSSLNAGELSPRIWRRLDFAKRKHGVKLSENFIHLVSGGVIRRPGTRFVAPVKYSDKKTRLLPFEFSRAIAYVLELGEHYVRFYTQNGRVEVPAHDTTVVNGFFVTNIEGWDTTGAVAWIPSPEPIEGIPLKPKELDDDPFIIGGNMGGA